MALEGALAHWTRRDNWTRRKGNDHDDDERTHDENMTQTQITKPETTGCRYQAKNYLTNSSVATKTAIWLLLPVVLILASCCALFAARPSHAHDQLDAHTVSGARSRREPPAIYSYSAVMSGEPPLSLSSHRSGRPYSWSNQRLARVLAPSLQDEQSAPLMGEQDDFSLLHGHQMDHHHHRQNSPAAAPAAAAGTKTARGSQGATKTSRGERKRPAVGANRRRLPGSLQVGGTKGVGSSVSSTRTKTHVVPAAAPAFEPDFSPSHAAEANTTQETKTATRAGKRRNLVCYYGTWAVYRPDAGKFSVENIDPFLCTHLIYGFTGLSYDNMIKPLDPWNDLEDNYGKGAMKRFTNLKRANPDLKTIVAIGGWNEGSIKYSKMASDPAARQKFVQSVVSFLEKYNFDGLDLDWEYPGSRGGASYDKQNFVRLTRELHEAFVPRGYLLTAAVSAGKWFIDPAYDIAQVSQYLDLINLMAYDYHGGWETKTGMNAPLFSSAQHDLSREDAMLNVNWSVNYWLAQGAPREKLMLGVGSYGRSFTLDKVQVNGLNAPASQKGQAGPYTREPGSLGYNELCEAFKRSPASWTIVRDPDYLAPYAYNNERQWVGYDDQESLTLKAQFAKSMGLGGMMMWSIETDDFRGLCHGEKFPLLNTMRRVLDGGGESGVVVVPKPSTTTTTTTTTTRKPSVQTQRPPIFTTSTTTRRPGGGGGHEVEEDGQRPPISSSSTRRPARPTTSSTRRPNPIRPTPTTTSTTTTTTRRPPPLVVTEPPRPPTGQQVFACREAGMFADPQNCRKFIRCVSLGSAGQWQSYKFDCGPGTAFNEQQGYCDHIYNVPNCSQQAAAPASSSLRSVQEHDNKNNNNNNYQLQPADHQIHLPTVPHHQLQPNPAGLILAAQYYPQYARQPFMMMRHHHHPWLH